MRYIFMDHTTHSTHTLGSIHTRLAQAPIRTFAKGLLLHTCHRIEWYTTDSHPAPIAELRDERYMTGEASGLTRLSQIAAGVQSLIVGDRLVFQQVEQAREHVLRRSRIDLFVDDALKIARNAREHFELWPDVDYADLPRHMRHSETRAGHAKTQLIIVGGGMLAQAILSASVASYDRIIMVTRNPVRLRGSLVVPNAADAPIVASAHETVTIYSQSPFDLVIATTSTNANYLQQASFLASHKNAGLVLDYSAVPMTLPDSARYMHVSDPGVLGWIRQENAAVEQRARAARKWILRAAEDIAHESDIQCDTGGG